jgi:hypothetical protein
MHLKSITGRSFLMAALVGLPIVSFAATRATDRDNPAAIELLKNMESAANDAADQASTLDSATLSTNASWEVHAQKLQALKDDVNEIGRIVSRLEEMRTSLSPADLDSLDRATALAKEMAGNSQAAIHYLNVDQQNFWSPTYRKSLSNVETESLQLASTVSRALAVDKARVKR